MNASEDSQSVLTAFLQSVQTLYKETVLCDLQLNFTAVPELFKSTKLLCWKGTGVIVETCIVVQKINVKSFSR